MSKSVRNFVLGVAIVFHVFNTPFVSGDTSPKKTSVTKRDIEFKLMLCMTQSEPTMTMAAISTVKLNASTFQRWLDEPFDLRLERAGDRD